MYSLFRVRFDWVQFVGIAIVLRLVFFDMGWLSFLAILIFLHQFLLLFNSLDYVIPIRYMFGTYMCIQMFVGPAFAYSGLDKYQYFVYQMKLSEADYFSYVMPAVIAFIIGLHITAGKLKGESLNSKSIAIFVNKHPSLPFWLVGIGFTSSVFADFFSANFTFIFYLLSGLKFVGLFMLFLGNTALKLPVMIAVIFSIVGSSLSQGMFHDLLTWLIMLGAIMAIRFKPSKKLKWLTFMSFILFVVIIQQLKGAYRTATSKGETAGIETFEKVYRAGEENNSIFSFQSLATSNVRINQGFIITNIMTTVPRKVPFSNGEELQQILEAAFLPRFLAPDKLTAGNRDIFMKYSGMRIQKGTSMGLSSVGDAYINFGIVGGCIFMFILGLLYSEVLNAFHKFSKNFPVLLLFTPLVFYYPIRPDCELQTILGHLVKSCFLIFVIFLVWKKEFRMNYRPFWKKYSS